MPRYPRSHHTTRSGKVIVMLALSLTAIVAAVALTADGGLLLDTRRQVQDAADMAALAAAIDLFKHYPTNSGSDPNSTADTAAKAVATSAGFTDGTNGMKVKTYIPPVTGDHVGVAGYVEVTIDAPQPSYFGGVFGSSSVNVHGRAVARGRFIAFKDGIIVLNLTLSESLKANGGGTVNVAGADIIVNSSDSQAVGGDGSNTVLKVVDGAFDLSGGVKTNTVLDGKVNWNQKPTPDPLAYLPAPTMPATALDVKNYTYNGNSSAIQSYLDALGLKSKDVGKAYLLPPGRYDSLPNFTNNDLVILQQASANSQNGVFYLNGSGFTSNGATIVVDPTGATSGGVMFYNNPGTSNNAGVSITGGTVTLNPPTSGIYQGLTLFQNRSAATTVSMTGQGGFSVYGTFYAAGAQLHVTGSNSANTDVIGSQYISDTLQAGGNGKYNVSWNVNKTARLRQIGLVE